MTKRILCTWIGMADLDAGARTGAARGPIARALTEGTFERVALLSDHSEAATASYVRWLERLFRIRIDAASVRLSSPMAFGEIYEFTAATLRAITSTHPGADLVFHLSPGTSAMASVWILLAKTTFPAQLIQSSLEHGVEIVSFPFDLAADYIPEIPRQLDEKLELMGLGSSSSAASFSSILYRSPEIARVIARARRAAPRSVPVLIYGESGTGKELFARAIHDASARRSSDFVAVNCGAIPSDLVEAELFGVVKGAYTGAAISRVGYIERASSGTLFLDEIGELPTSAQVKLLRVIQEKEVTPVGDTKPRRVDLRIVAATNRDLLADVVNGKFREDLFHRLAVAVLKVPPLRERRGDLSMLLDHFLKKLDSDLADQPDAKPKVLTARARNLLLRHRWPGNVRELANTLQRLLLWSTKDLIDETEVREALMILDSRANVGCTLGPGFRISDLLDDTARECVIEALREAAGNKGRAAKLLGLNSHQTLSNWMKRLGISEAQVASISHSSEVTPKRTRHA